MALVEVLRECHVFWWTLFKLLTLTLNAGESVRIPDHGDDLL